MNKIVSRGLWFTVILGGLSLAGVGAANAAETGGDSGVASGDQAGISINLPITLGGNAISVIGDSSSTDATTMTQPAADPAPAEPAPAAEPAADPAPAAPAPTTSGDNSILGGLQGIVDVSVPVTIGGNAISVIGDSTTTDATTTVDSAATASGGSNAGASTSGDNSILGGLQGIIDASVPVTVAGNAISGIGDSTTTNATTSVVSDAGGSTSGSPSTSGDDSILGGIQLPIGASLPVTVAGNAISGIGDSTSTDATTTVASAAGGGNPVTSGIGSILGGIQLPIGVNAPVTIGGNAISVIGDSTTTGATTIVTTPTEPTTPTTPTEPTEPTTPTTPTTPVVPIVPTTPVVSVMSVQPVTSGVGSGQALAGGATAGAGLADTGSDLGGLLALMALLLAAGLGLTAVRRTMAVRSAHSRQ